MGETLRIDVEGQGADARYFAVRILADYEYLNESHVRITVQKKMEGPRRETVAEARQDIDMLKAVVEA